MTAEEFIATSSQQGWTNPKVSANCRHAHAGDVDPGDVGPDRDY